MALKVNLLLVYALFIYLFIYNLFDIHTYGTYSTQNIVFYACSDLQDHKKQSEESLRLS